MTTATDEALLAGLLIGEGHFGGDGRQPQVTLRMHLRHERLFRWIERTFPGGRLYGPYHHGGRDYYQWMARGPFLRNELVPMLFRWLTPELDEHSYGRFRQMCERYGIAATRTPIADAPAPHPLAHSSEAAPQMTDERRADGGHGAELTAIFSKLRGSAG